MDILGLDFVGPLAPASESGNRYIIILVDYFTQYMFACAVPQATGDEARGLLESVVELLHSHYLFTQIMGPTSLERIFMGCWRKMVFAIIRHLNLTQNR